MRDQQAVLQAELEAAVNLAFDEYGASCLWSKRRPARIVPGTARAIAYSLRLEAPARARRLVEKLEDLADALDPIAAADPVGHR